VQRLRKLFNQRWDNAKKKALKKKAQNTPVGQVSQPTVQPAAGEAPLNFVSATTAREFLRAPVPAPPQPQPMPRRAAPPQIHATLPRPAPPDDQAHAEASAEASAEESAEPPSSPTVAFMAWSPDAVTNPLSDNVAEPDPPHSPPSSPTPPAFNPFGRDENFENTLNNMSEVKDGKYTVKQNKAAVALAARNKKIDGKNDVGATEAVCAVLNRSE
jgi:hypothetical protein